MEQHAHSLPHWAAPQEAGFAAEALATALRFAQDNDSAMDRDIGQALRAGHFGEPMPLGAPIGPSTPRGGPAGVILRGGKVAAQWGDPARVDMSFSISKSYLALLAGIAVQDGLISDLDAPVSAQIDSPHFDSPQNRPITWAQLLQLTSEWQGELWGKPDWIDHYRDLSATGERPPIGTRHPLQSPGSFWEYNDVRVNALALALTLLFGRALPELLKERILDPIGASDSWAWHGYDNSYVEIDGHQVQSVSGGAHWGGGLWMSSLDHAQVGQLMLQGGAWQGAQIIDAAWVEACRAPCPLNRNYGLLWWLNTGGAQFPGASEASYFALGVGSQIIWIDPEADMVVVARWVEKSALPEFIRQVTAAHS
ncbi:serine hydrolase domain-containing protein [Candidatus Rhodobacter oscarellae]|nr:serine hydrolase [Candidatus Rhodobacter lobularis]